MKILHVVERFRIIIEATDISLNNKLSVALHPIDQVKGLQWKVSRYFVDGDVEPVLFLINIFNVYDRDGHNQRTFFFSLFNILLMDKQQYLFLSR